MTLFGVATQPVVLTPQALYFRVMAVLLWLSAEAPPMPEVNHRTGGQSQAIRNQPLTGDANLTWQRKRSRTLYKSLPETTSVA